VGFGDSNTTLIVDPNDPDIVYADGETVFLKGTNARTSGSAMPT
jgi:hypothetical protein